jgi:hypothetical protein
VRVKRSVDRHVEFGKTPHAAAAWVAEIDQPNGETVLATTGNADRIIVADAAGQLIDELRLSDVAARVAVVAVLATTAGVAMATADDDGPGVLDVHRGGLFPVGPVGVVWSAVSSTHGWGSFGLVRQSQGLELIRDEFKTMAQFIDGRTRMRTRVC